MARIALCLKEGLAWRVGAGCRFEEASRALAGALGGVGVGARSVATAAASPGRARRNEVLPPHATALSGPDAWRSHARLLEQLGLSGGEAAALLARSPGIADTPAAALRAKLLFCRERLGLAPREVLLHHRGFLLEGLPSVDQRIRFMEQRGQLHRLAECGDALWVFDSPPRFCARFGVGPEEWREWVSRWETTRARAML